MNFKTKHWSIISAYYACSQKDFAVPLAIILLFMNHCSGLWAIMHKIHQISKIPTIFNIFYAGSLVPWNVDQVSDVPSIFFFIISCKILSVYFFYDFTKIKIFKGPKSKSATQWTFYSATSFLEKCRKVVPEKWFFKLGFFFLVNHFSLTWKNVDL